MPILYGMVNFLQPLAEIDFDPQAIAAQQNSQQGQQSQESKDKKLIEQLLERDPRLCAALEESQIVEDVLECQILKRTVEDAKNTATSGGQMPPNYPAGNNQELLYLPQGKLEKADEYAKRIRMTPCFTKTGGILSDRIGAIASDPPELVGDEKDLFAEFEADCTGQNQSLESQILRLSRLMQERGYAAVLVDRMPQPPEVRARAQSQNEFEQPSAAEIVNQPRIVLYSAKQILWIENDDTGIKWIKLVECTYEKPSWDADVQQIETVRVFDRQNVQSWIIKDRKTVSIGTKQAHGFDAVPVVLAQPFTNEDGVGRASLLGCAQADVSATRILSDIVWTLFMIGNPLLTAIVQDPAEFEKNMKDTNAGRFITLKTGGGTQDAESLQFAVLDVNGLQLMVEMFHHFQLEAEAQAGKDSPGALTQPLGKQAQSGVSKAWGFKTGQERVLFLLTRELQSVFSQVMALCAQVVGSDPEKIDIEFGEDFDMGSPDEQIDNATKILPIVAPLSKTAKAEIVKSLLRRSYPALPNIDQIYDEIDDGIEAQDAKIQSGELNPDGTPKPPAPVIADKSVPEKQAPKL